MICYGARIGFYGTSDTATFSEASSSGSDYLAEVCREWEAEALKAKTGRTVILRAGGDFHCMYEQGLTQGEELHKTCLADCRTHVLQPLNDASRG